MNLRFSKLGFLWQLAIKKVYIHFFLRNIINKNELIQADAYRGLIAYQCNKMHFSSYQKVAHMLIYYPAFAFLFRFRSGLRSFWFERLFMPQPFSAKIFSGTKIAGGLTCFHPYGTVINAKSIGKNFIFRNGLTIGNKNDDNTQIPEIGDNVEVGANVVIIGKIRIGNNVTVGAGSVVVKDIPDNAIVAGNPARIIRLKDKEPS